MSGFFDTELLLRWLQIVLIDLMLAGDNALVIALAVRDLPRETQFWGRVWGTLGAVILRLAFIVGVTFLLKIPFLQFGGGILLLLIGIKLVRQPASADENVRAGVSLFDAIWVIIVADVVMSLDNVVAVAGAAHGDYFLVAFGIALSLPLVVWGSGVLARLMHRFPWIVWLGGGVLGHVAGNMMLLDSAVAKAVGSAKPALQSVLPWGLAAGLTALGWWFSRKRKPS